MARAATLARQARAAFAPAAALVWRQKEGASTVANHGVASAPLYCGASAASPAQLALTLSRSELDLRLALEESGREDFLCRLPQALQQMLNEPGLVLARPDWLREFMLWIYIGAPAPHPAP